ncbi:uncharacterized protein [Linepithema humile]|uniref:uncharacterized protein isoform X1 n=1 Tax=Linepithema humile TaxID=83485 RepID=UPI000623B46B|nr:PREDICTED: integumentary mucin A.1-like isoform X1 [Linepithema humile]
MRLFGVLLLFFLVCQLTTSTPIFDRDGAGLGGHRSAGFGDTIRDWLRVLKNRVVEKWQDWFGNDSPTPRLSPQDILNIDKTLESRISSYPGLFLDLSSLSFDSNQDWGVRIGNWYLIRKVTGNDYNSDSDSDEWDMKPLLSNLPVPPILGIDWSKTNVFGTPEAPQPPTTTPRIQSTTPRIQSTTPRIQSTTSRPTTVIPLEPVSTSTESIVTTESTVISTEPIQLTTQFIVTPTEPIVTSTESILTPTEEILTSSESVLINNESVTVPAETTLMSTEPIFMESTVPTTVISTELNVPFTTIASESTVMSTEGIVNTTTTESPATSTELTLPVLNKRIEDNETIDKRTTRKPRPASAEVIF